MGRVTKKLHLVIINFLIFWVSSAHAQIQPTANVQDPTTEYRAILDQYCVTCHNQTLKTADLMLDTAVVNEVGHSPLVWEKVLLKLKTRSMPPIGMPRPDGSFYESFVSYLEQELDSAAAANPNPGRTVSAHRLNRREYTNAIRDLFGLEIDGASLLPADNSGSFDNMGSLLSVSQLLMERYMSAAYKISRLVIGDPTLPSESQTYIVSPLLLQTERMNEELPFGTRGGIAVKHYFPLDGDYELKVRLQRSDKEQLIVGIAEPHRLDVRVDGESVKLFKVGGEHRGMAQVEDDQVDASEAEYERTADDKLLVRLPVKAGTHLVQAAFLEEDFAWERRVPRPTFDSYFKAAVSGRTGKTYFARRGKSFMRPWEEPGVSSIQITGAYNIKGPGNTVSRDRLFICLPTSKAEEEPCARKIMTSLGRLAYRRTVNEGDIKPLLDLYQQGRNKGGNFEAGIRVALEGLLTSPAFLFRMERDPVNVTADMVYPITDLELASRLSFFFWSSIPDAELLNVAEQGGLSKPEVLEQQVKRMLEDSRSESLINNFTQQWLLLRNFPYVEKNEEEFPEFTENLRRDFEKETQLFIASVLQEGRSVLDLFRADYKFVNERLGRHYEIPGVFGNKFRRVAVDDNNKKGLLAHGSILAITSYANRTSPVIRGKYVLENLLASPPPPPPPNIPALKQEDEGGVVLTGRAAIEKHRANPACAVCHNRMDPIGFGLENFNPVGQWRTEDAGYPIDSSGMLPDGSRFQGPYELQEALLKQPDVIVNAFTRKLLIYALGRDLEYYDMPTVRHIVRTSAGDDYRFSDIVLGIVNSLPFKMRRTNS